MGSSSRDLLQSENKYFPAPSSLESILRICEKDCGPKKPQTDGKPLTTPLPRSQILGKVKDFIGVISEANKRLQKDAKDNSEKYDIEVLTGKESEVVEMDLMLGIADLHTPEAVAAAESALGGDQALIPLAASSSETESEDTSYDSESDDEDSGSESDGESDDEDSGSESDSESDDEDSDDGESDNEDNDVIDNVNGNNKTRESGNNDSTEGVGNQSSKKRQKIVELS